MEENKKERKGQKIKERGKCNEKQMGRKKGEGKDGRRERDGKKERRREDIKE